MENNRLVNFSHCTMKPFVLPLLTGAFLLNFVSSAAGQSRFSLSVNAAPVWNLFDTRAVFALPDANGNLQTTDFATKGHGFGYSFGLLGRYHLSPRWSVATGVWGVRDVSSTFDMTLSGQTVTINMPLSRQAFVDYAVPLLINYQPSLRRLSPYLTAGATANIPGARYVDLGTGSVRVRFDRTITFSPLLGLGAAYRLSDRFTLMAQPTAQLILPRGNTDYERYRVYGLSLQTQVQYRF